MDTTTLLLIGAAVLGAIWLVGLLRRIGGCLIHLLLLGALALAAYSIYTGQVPSLP